MYSGGIEKISGTKWVNGKEFVRTFYEELEKTKKRRKLKKMIKL